jgi:hypothetical protein
MLWQLIFHPTKLFYERFSLHGRTIRFPLTQIIQGPYFIWFTLLSRLVCCYFATNMADSVSQLHPCCQGKKVVTVCSFDSQSCRAKGCCCIINKNCNKTATLQPYKIWNNHGSWIIWQIMRQEWILRTTTFMWLMTVIQIPHSSCM